MSLKNLSRDAKATVREVEHRYTFEFTTQTGIVFYTKHLTATPFGARMYAEDCIADLRKNFETEDDPVKHPFRCRITSCATAPIISTGDWFYSEKTGRSLGGVLPHLS
jgi:hypothetical protein